MGPVSAGQTIAAALILNEAAPLKTGVKSFCRILRARPFFNVERDHAWVEAIVVAGRNHTRHLRRDRALYRRVPVSDRKQYAAEEASGRNVCYWLQI